METLTFATETDIIITDPAEFDKRSQLAIIGDGTPAIRTRPRKYYFF